MRRPFSQSGNQLQLQLVAPLQSLRFLIYTSFSTAGVNLLFYFFFFFLLGASVDKMRNLLSFTVSAGVLAVSAYV